MATVTDQTLLGATDSATLSTLGEYASAEATYRELINLAEKPLATLGAQSNLGFVLNKEKKYAEAAAVLRDLLPLMKERFGEDDSRSLGCLRHLMEAVGGQGRVDEALLMNERGMRLVTGMGAEHKEDEIVAMEGLKVKLEEWKSNEQEL
jgi:tetratricopeptide (TPR) repeat protein